jgi:pimeloyl-ACP methyl ester carboxylesterase
MAAQAALTSYDRIHVIPNYGHYVPLERPKALNEIAAAVIQDIADRSFDSRER